MAKSNIYRDTIQPTLRSAKAQAYQRIESVLEAAGADGVHGSYFVYALFWPQFRARINEMNKLGWEIQGVDLPKSEWVRGIRTKYVLLSKPREVAPGEDWYEKLKGKPRPTDTDDLPLFNGAVRE
jgi:hypothetical protein